MQEFYHIFNEKYSYYFELGAFSGTTNLDNQIDLILGREQSYEKYGIKSLSISAVAQTSQTSHPVPEPTTILLLGSGIATLFCLKKLKK